MLNNNDLHHSGMSSSSSGFSVDIGPMITMALMRWLINTCDNYSASRIHRFVQARHDEALFSAKDHAHHNSTKIDEMLNLTTDAGSNIYKDLDDVNDNAQDVDDMYDVDMDANDEAIVLDELSNRSVGMIDAVD